MAVGAVAAAGLSILTMATWRAERRIEGSAWAGAAERIVHDDATPAGAIRALAAFSRGLAADPTDLPAALRSAHWFLVAGQPQDSLHAAQHALALEPNSPNAWRALAAADLASGHPSDARAHAARALSLLHDYPAAIRLHGDASEEEGDLSAARADKASLAEIAGRPLADDTTRSAQTILHEWR
jgi:tetratricopeptide (TPR) repeat protein